MKKQNYQIYALITIFFWSMAFIFTRMTLPYFSASSLGFLRYLIASAALIVIVLVTKMKPPQLKDCPLFLLSGAIGFFLYMITFNQGLVSVPAATASVVNATVPAVTALIAGVVYKEKIRKVQWIAILIELVGVAVLTVMSGGLSAGKGLLWMFGAALSLSTYNILQRKLTQTYTALQASTFSIFFGTLLLAIFALQDSFGTACNVTGDGALALMRRRSSMPMLLFWEFSRARSLMCRGRWHLQRRSAPRRSAILWCWCCSLQAFLES